MITQTWSSERQKKTGGRSGGCRFCSLYRTAFRRNLGLFILSTLSIFIIFPLQYIFTVYSYRQTVSFEGSRLEHVLQGSAEIYSSFSVLLFPMVMMIYPIVIASILFFYLHRKASADLFHALPVSRPQLFLSQYMVGLTFLLLPLAVSFGVILLYGGFYAGTAYHPQRILMELLGWSVSGIAIFTISSFVAVNTGTAFDQVVFTIGTSCAVPGLYLLVTLFVDQTLVGFSMENAFFSPSKLLMICPFTVMIDRMNRGEVNGRLDTWGNDWALLLWGVVSLLLLGASLLIYRRRPSEFYGRSTSRGVLKSLLKYVATVFCGFGLALLFSGFGSEVITVLGGLLGAALCYVIFEAVFARGFSTLKRTLPGLSLSVVGTVVCISAIVTGWFGFDSYLPSLDELASVEINYDGYYENMSDYWAFPREEFVQLTGRENMEAVLAYHQAVMQENNPFSQTGDRYYAPCSVIRYRLTDGRTVVRSYDWATEETSSLLQGIDSAEEFVRQRDPLFRISADQIVEVELYDAAGARSRTLSLTRQEREELLEAIRADRLEESVQDLFTPESPQLGSIQLDSLMAGSEPKSYGMQLGSAKEENRYTSFYLVKPTSTRTLAMLERLGASELLQPDLSQFDRVLLAPSSLLGTEEGAVFVKSPEGWNSYLNVETPQSVWFDCEEYTDPEDLQALYGCSYLQYRCSSRDYFAVFWLKEENRGATLFIPGDKLPERFRADMEKLEGQLE